VRASEPYSSSRLVVITEPAHAALQAYARQRDDRDLEVWTAEIKLRASVRIGELVRELDTHERVRTDLRPSAGKQTKGQAIRDAGLSKSTANRYEGLAGSRHSSMCFRHSRISARPNSVGVTERGCPIPAAATSGWPACPTANRSAVRGDSPRSNMDRSIIRMVDAAVAAFIQSFRSCEYCPQESVLRLTLQC
jgi:hypothetical protein